MMKERKKESSRKSVNCIDPPPKSAHEGEQTTQEETSYLRFLTRRRLLTAEEEIELAYRARQGDQQARNLLVEANMRLVVSIARHYNTSLISFEDIVQEGAIGLMKAVERFDPQRGCRLSTYATPWIRQAISRAIDTKAKAIRVPAHVAESLRRLEKARLQLLTELQEEPTAEQLAERLGMPVVKVRLLLQTAQEPLSLDTLVGEEVSTPLLALLNDQDTADPQEVVIEEERRQQIGSLFSVLTPREAEVMRLRLGFEGNCEQMLQKIGETLHLSRERVRQIEILAMKKLKAAARLRALEEYLGT